MYAKFFETRTIILLPVWQILPINNIKKYFIVKLLKLVTLTDITTPMYINWMFLNGENRLQIKSQIQC